MHAHAHILIHTHTQAFMFKHKNMTDTHGMAHTHTNTQRLTGPQKYTDTHKMDKQTKQNTDTMQAHTRATQIQRDVFA